MLSPFTRLSRTPPAIWISLFLSVLILIGAGLLGALYRSQQLAPDPPPQVVVQVLPTTNPGTTPKPLLPSETSPAVLFEPVETPVSLPTDTLPSIEPTAIEPTATASVAVILGQATATKPPATAQASNDPNLLPNGVRYGERRPKLPNRIVRIASSDIKLDTEVYEVYAPKSVWEVADYAGGHHYDSRNPGEGGNIVVSGHNNWRGEVFRYLELLKPGHTINVWTLDGKKYTYEVQELKKLKEAGASMAQRLLNAKVMDPTPTEQLTLITCWPYKTFTHRIIVIAKPLK